MTALERLNHRLKVAKIGVTVEQHKNRLYIRATLPPKPNDFNTAPYQQRIALKVYANAEGLAYAEAKAKEIGGLLAQDRFDWQVHLKNSHRGVISDWIEAFEDDYFSNKERTSTTIETYKNDYIIPFSRLPEDKEISEKLLRKIILEKTTADTRNRRRYVLAYAKLADLVGLAHDLRKLMGDYSLQSVSPRSIPSDQEIAKLYYQFDNRAYQWIYGVMATYGLRNHETFFVDFDDYPIAWVNRGKTNERYVWPLFPEWADRWELKQIVLPECSAKTHGGFGRRVTVAFERYEIPFTPYNLRHA